MEFIEFILNSISGLLFFTREFQGSAVLRSLSKLLEKINWGA